MWQTTQSRGRKIAVLEGGITAADHRMVKDNIVYNQQRDASLCPSPGHSIAQVVIHHSVFFLARFSKAARLRNMFSKIASILALVASANAHGYLSSPMSRTGLNAQVSVFIQSTILEAARLKTVSNIL
jgi:alanine racemase